MLERAAYIEKIAYYLPDTSEDNLPGQLTEKIGISRRHIAAEGETAADLAAKAAEKLGLCPEEKAGIDFLLFCTESPDYVLPPTACLLQDRLGLPRSIGAFDYNHACSGYVYGLSLAKGLIESGQAEKVLLLTGETYSKHINREDMAVRPLFGDAATATLLSAFNKTEKGLDGFIFGTDGGHFQDFWVPGGGARNPLPSDGASDLSGLRDIFGNYRTAADIHMVGAAVSNFALRAAPDALEKVLAKTGKSREEIDYFVFHQANKFILDLLRLKCGLKDSPFWIDVEKYGNTVSNSLPIAIADMRWAHPDATTVLCIAFGAGLSWGGCLLRLDKLKD